MVSIHYAYYNFCRVHQNIARDDPAMEAGISDHVWTIIEELVSVLEHKEPPRPHDTLFKWPSVWDRPADI